MKEEVTDGMEHRSRQRKTMVRDQKDYFQEPTLGTNFLAAVTPEKTGRIANQNTA